MDIYYNTESSSTVPAPPTLRVSCSQRDPWKSLWGPEITCTSDPSNTQFLNVGFTANRVPSHRIAPLNDYFKCNIISKHVYNYDVEYHCEKIDSALSDISSCVYNTSIWLSNVLSPVAELDLLLPSSRQGIGTSEFKCDTLRQVLNCPDLPLNSSFYENSFETHWLANPIQCFLSYTIMGHDDRQSDEPDITSNTESPIVLREIANITASAMELTSNGLAAGVGYEWFFICVLIFVVAGAVGSLLVCFAVLLDRRLQNVTNYFLFSLAIADLLVSLVVMPLGAIPSLMGEWKRE